MSLLGNQGKQEQSDLYLNGLQGYEAVATGVLGSTVKTRILNDSEGNVYMLMVVIGQQFDLHSETDKFFASFQIGEDKNVK